MDSAQKLLHNKRSVYVAEDSADVVVYESPAKRAAKATTRPARGHKGWAEHSQRNVRDVNLRADAVCGAKCTLDCKLVPLEMVKFMRNTVEDQYGLEGPTGRSAGVELVLKSCIVFGTVKTKLNDKNNTKRNAKNPFGVAVPGATTNCAWCKTLPVAQQTTRQHRLLEYKDWTGDKLAKNRRRGVIGCPNFAASEVRKAELVAGLVADLMAPADARDAAGCGCGRANCRGCGRKANQTENQYFLPNKDSRQFRVCRRYAHFVLGVGKTILKPLGDQSRRAPLPLSAGGLLRPEEKRGAASRESMDTKRETNMKMVSAVIKGLPRTASHFKTNKSASAKYLLDPTLNNYKLWQMLLDKYDPEFAALARKHNFWCTADDKKRSKTIERPVAEPHHELQYIPGGCARI